MVITAQPTLGNRKTSTVDGVTTSFDYDLNDRLLTAGSVTYGYDDQGNQLSITDGIGSTRLLADAAVLLLTVIITPPLVSC